MRRVGNRRVVRLMTWALGCQGLLGLAVAGSPFQRELVERSPAEEHRSASARPIAVPRLDLSLPLEMPRTIARADLETSVAPLNNATAANDDDFAHPLAWRGLGPKWTNSTRIQDLVRNQRRDGVPLARLWQGRGATLNLGLSPRGKPGIWFVKAVP